MATKRIEIELRVEKKGSVFSWEVFLENTNKSSRVEDGWNYNSEKKYYYVTLENYPIEDDNLDVFLGCEGKLGGTTICTVLINDVEQDEKVSCNNIDPDYGHQEYSLI